MFRSNTDDGARRGGVVANSGVVSRRQILSSLQEEEEEHHQQQAAALRGNSGGAPKMDKIHMDKRRYHDRHNYDDYGYHALDSLSQHHHQHAHGIRETRSLERFIPHVSLSSGGMDAIGGGRFHSGYHSDTSDIYAASARSAATSKPRTIYSHGGGRGVGRAGVGCKDIDSADMDPTPPYSRFSLSFNTSPASRVLNMVTDPVLGEPAYMRWPQPQPRRTKSISCSPTASSPFDDDMTLSSLSLTSSTGTSGSGGSALGSGVTAASGKRFSRCLLLQSISKEEMRYICNSFFGAAIWSKKILILMKSCDED